jgi:hypothetical protein
MQAVAGSGTTELKLSLGTSVFLTRGYRNIHNVNLPLPQHFFGSEK